MTERRGVVLTIAVGVALVTIAATAALSGGQVRRLQGHSGGAPMRVAADPDLATPPAAPRATMPPTADSDGHRFDWVLQLALVLVVVALIVAAVVVARRLGRRARAEREPDPGGEPEPDLTATERASRAVRSGLDDLDAAGSDPRGVVIGCWLALERSAAAAGLPRRDSDSPTDLVGRLLVGADVPAPVLDRLAALYRAARYAPDEVTDAGRDAARQALTEVARALERPRPDRAPEVADHAGDTGAGHAGSAGAGRVPERAAR